MAGTRLTADFLDHGSTCRRRLGMDLLVGQQGAELHLGELTLRATLTMVMQGLAAGADCADRRPDKQGFDEHVEDRPHPKLFSVRAMDMAVVLAMNSKREVASGHMVAN